NPFTRARRKALGQRAHEVLAAVLRADDRVGQGFGLMPAREEAETRLAAALAERRRQWPDDRYWDSFAAELAQVCRALLANVYALAAGPYVATEVRLPEAAEVRRGGAPIAMSGRLDLVRLDRPEWRGAEVDIVDFKTGGDADLSAERMGRTGASLQLGIYLAAAQS